MSINEYFRMSNVFGPQPTVRPTFPSMKGAFMPQEQEQAPPVAQPPARIPSAYQTSQPPQSISALSPEEEFAASGQQPQSYMDQFIQSAMNPQVRTQPTVPKTALSGLEAALKIAAEPSPLDKNRVWVDGYPYQQQKMITDAEGKQHFVTNVHEPKFMDQVMRAMPAAIGGAVDTINQPYQDQLDDWKLKNEGLKNVASIEAQRALADQRRSTIPYNLARPSIEQDKLSISRMTAEERIRASKLNTMTDEQKIAEAQAGRVSLADLNNAAAMQRVEAQQTGANQRTAATQAGANARTAATQAGADRRNAATIAGADRRNAATIAARKTGGISESQSKIAQQRVANEIIDEMPDLGQYITYDENGFPVISEELDPQDRQVILDEFNRRLGIPSQPVAGTTPPLPAPPAPNIAAPPPPVQPPAGTQIGQPNAVEMITPDGRGTRMVPLNQVETAKRQGYKAK